MRFPDDITTIVDELEYVADHPTRFIKAEMVEFLAIAAGVIRDLRIIVGDTPDYRLGEMKPEGSA